MDILNPLTSYWQSLTPNDLICAVLVLVGTIAYAIGELWSQGKLKWMYETANPEGFWGDRSYNRKYASPLVYAPASWYYRVNDIKYRERFPGSATVFAGLTDGYHLCQAVFLASFSFAIAVQTDHWIANGILIRLLIGVVFTTSYYKLNLE